MKMLIKRSFSRFSMKYEKEAILQKEAGKYLIQFSEVNKKNFNKILDLGCGTGFLGEFLNKKLVGIDISKDMLKIAKEKNYFVLQGDIENLPLKNKSFDFILSNFSLHWLNLEMALKESSRVLKDNGYISFNIPIENSLQAIEDILGEKYFYFKSEKDILHLVKKYFQIEKLEKAKFIKTFSNGYEFLIHLHNTGVSINPNDKSFKKKKEIINKFKSYNLETILNYELLYIKGKTFF